MTKENLNNRLSLQCALFLKTAWTICVISKKQKYVFPPGCFSAALRGTLATTVPLALWVTEDRLPINMVFPIWKLKKKKKSSLTSDAEEDMDYNSHKFLETCDSFKEK